MQNDKNYATLKKVQPKFSPGWDEINGKIISTWNLGIIGANYQREDNLKRTQVAFICSVAILALFAASGVQLGSGAQSESERTVASAVPRRLSKTIVVTSTADSGTGTLRQALLDAKSGDTITFDATVFPPSNPNTIQVTSELPGITQGHLTIDSSNAGVILDGSKATGDDINGFQIVSSDSNAIRGLQVSNFSGAGIVINGDAKYNIVGGDRSVGIGPFGQGNMTSLNGVGIALWSDGTIGASLNTITGNFVGTDAANTEGLGNGTGFGLTEGANHNVIGPQNIVGHNDECGVYMRDPNTLGNMVTQNSIHDNNLGICLSDGANEELSAPAVLDFDLSAGTVAGITCPSCTVEVFSDSEDQGEKYEGRITADGSGSFNFSKGSSLSGPHLTATATDAEGNTSAFSQPTSGESRSLIIQAGNYLPRTLIKTRQSNELEDNLIGNMSSLNVSTERDAAEFLEGTKKWGYKWLHISLDYLDWSEVADTGEYSQFYINPIHDQLITDLVANGVKINYLLVYWDENIEPVSVGYSRFKTEEEVQRYLDYARFIVHNFKGRVDHYQILHESFYSGPDAEGFSQQQIELADYVNLVKRVVPVIREEDPDAKIVIGSAPSLYESAVYNYQKGILESDAMSMVDGFAWHPGPYPLEYNETIDYIYQVPNTVQELETIAAANGFTGELFVCDGMFWSTTLNPSPTEPWNLYSEIDAAKYYGRGIIDHQSMGVIAILAATSNENLPKMDVIRNLATLMAGAKPSSLPVEVESSGVDIKQYTFSLPNDSYLIAIWQDKFVVENDPGIPMTVTLPGFAGNNVVGIDVLNSLQQTLITSEEDGNLVIRNLLVKDYPIILRVTPTKYMYLPTVFHGYGQQ